MKRRVEVSLLGQNFSVRTDRDDAFVHGLASLLTRRFEELRRGARNASAHQLTLLLALTLAEELLVEQEEHRALRSSLRTTAEGTLERVRQALAMIDDGSPSTFPELDGDAEGAVDGAFHGRVLGDHRGGASVDLGSDVGGGSAISRADDGRDAHAAIPARALAPQGRSGG